LSGCAICAGQVAGNKWFFVGLVANHSILSAKTPTIYRLTKIGSVAVVPCVKSAIMRAVGSSLNAPHVEKHITKIA